MSRDEQIKKLADEMQAESAMNGSDGLIPYAAESIRKDEEIAAAYDRGWRVGLESATGMAQEEIARKDEAIAALKDDVAEYEKSYATALTYLDDVKAERDSLREAIAAKDEEIEELKLRRRETVDMCQMLMDEQEAKDKLLVQAEQLLDIGSQGPCVCLMYEAKGIDKKCFECRRLALLAAIRERGKE